MIHGVILHLVIMEMTSPCLKSLYLSLFLLCRIESIGLVEIQGEYGSVQKREITLVDNDGVKLKFVLWGEQVLLANLFR